MKKFLFTLIILLLICSGIGVYLFYHSDFTNLSTIKGTITSTKSNDSLTTFKTTRKNTIVVSCDSTIEQGTLSITLIDSSGTVIKDFEVDKNYSEAVTLKKNTEYKLLVSYKGFIGDFEVKCK